MSVAALVPMRHDSERVPGKNYRTLGDRPLFAHIVDTLLVCDAIDQVVIDTDSATIRELAWERYGGRVTVLDRPEGLRGGHVPMNEVLLHDVKQVPADLYVQTHSTNPLLRAETVAGALAAFQVDAQHDALFSVTRLQSRFFDADGHPLNHDPAMLLRTQDLPPVYEENSNLYVFTGPTLQETGSRSGKNALMYEIPAEEAWDIDEELDFRIAEFLWSIREGEA